MASIINLKARSKYLEDEIKKLQSIIKKAPEGSLITRNNQSGSVRYYRKIRQHDGKYKEIHLGKDKYEEAVDIAHRQYAEKKLAELLQEKNLIDKLLGFAEKGSDADRWLMEHPGIRRLLKAENVSDGNWGIAWKNASYRKNTKYPEKLIYPTVVQDLKVRSKAEADIVSRLEYYGVPYHYEEIYTINGIDYAIDFTCLNVESKKIWYWDHRGLSDNADYIRKVISCDDAFMNAGIIQGINLIVTTETKDHPLDLQWVDELIRFYLL